jgi:hypothetical protein
MNEETRSSLMRVLEYARDVVRDDRRKATKHDTAVRIASSLHAQGREGVEAAWEETDDFHEKWKMKSRDVLARSEFRRRKLNKRYDSRAHLLGMSAAPQVGALGAGFIDALGVRDPQAWTFASSHHLTQLLNFAMWLTNEPALFGIPNNYVRFREHEQ